MSGDIVSEQHANIEHEKIQQSKSLEQTDIEWKISFKTVEYIDKSKIKENIGRQHYVNDGAIDARIANKLGSSNNMGSNETFRDKTMVAGSINIYNREENDNRDESVAHYHNNRHIHHNQEQQQQNKTGNSSNSINTLSRCRDYCWRHSQSKPNSFEGIGGGGLEAYNFMENFATTTKISNNDSAVDANQQRLETKNNLTRMQVLSEKPTTVAKKNFGMLNKNHSTTNLTEYINPEFLMRHRASLHQNAIEMKKVRQREAYKTAMCQAWLEGKECSFGDQCNFAHGENELQPLPANRSNPKYKTRICENYTTTGICPFGNRCFFIHPQSNSKLDDLTSYNEPLSNRNRQLEGKVANHISKKGSAGATPNMPRRAVNKAKEFRKLESCGNFYTQYQLQQLQQQQDLHGQFEDIRLQEEHNLYQNYAQLSTVAMIEHEQWEQQQQNDSRRASKSTVMSSGSMPMMHSNSISNLCLQPICTKQAPQINNNGNGNVDKRLEERRLTLRKMQSQKSFSSSDVWMNRSSDIGERVKPKPLLEMDTPAMAAARALDLYRQHQQREQQQQEKDEDTDSSGPHTPPGFYETNSSSKWSSVSSSIHPAHIWSGLSTATEQEEQQQQSPQKVLPSFSLFGPTNEYQQIVGSCDRDLSRLGRIVGSGNSGFNAIDAIGTTNSGKKSPIVENLDGIYMGRRSSHTPYLDEGENTQALLSVLLEPGMHQKGKNRSAEYLGERNRCGGGALTTGTENNRWLGSMQQPEDSWQMGARSTGALNEQGVPWKTQFGPSREEKNAKQRVNVVGEEDAGTNVRGSRVKNSGDIGCSRRKYQQQQQDTGNYLQHMVDYQQQQQRLVAQGFISAAMVKHAMPGIDLPEVPEPPHFSAFRPIQQRQREMYFNEMQTQTQSPYSSSNSVHSGALDELIGHGGSSSLTNLDVIRKIWAARSPELKISHTKDSLQEKKQQNEQQQQQPDFHRCEFVDSTKNVEENQKMVKIPSRLNLYSGVVKRNDGLLRVIKLSKDQHQLSRNNTLTDKEVEEQMALGNQKQQQTNFPSDTVKTPICTNAPMVPWGEQEFPCLTGTAPNSKAEAASECHQKADSGAQTWAKRAMKKAFLRQKSHSSPSITCPGSSIGGQQDRVNKTNN